MNAGGGSLFIGVSDAGKPMGIDRDLKVIPRGDLDGFENWLTTLLENSIGGAATSNVAVVFPKVNGSTVCQVVVRPGASPTYVTVKGEDWFYVRLGNSTRRLPTREAVGYIKQHWGG
jgi:predicted HTH transcriptional regulator